MYIASGVNTALQYLHKLSLLHVTSHFKTCSQNRELHLYLFLHWFRQRKVHTAGWWVPVFIHLRHLGTMIDYWDRCGLLNVVIELAQRVCWVAAGMKMYWLSAAQKIRGIFCALLQLFWLVVSTCLGLRRKRGCATASVRLASMLSRLKSTWT